MAQKERNTEGMAPAETIADKKAPAVVVAEKKQPIKVTNLDTNEDETVTLVIKTYKVNAKLPVQEQLKAISAHVTPDSEKVKALVKYAESQSYQEAKAAALGKGNYLTQQIKSAVVMLLSTYPAFSEMGNKEIYDRWFAGYKEGKASAKTVLEQAKAAAGTNEVDF